MSLLGLRPRVHKMHPSAQTRCNASCAALEETEHIRRHLMEDLSMACAEASRAQKHTWMRFAVFEQGIPEGLRDGVTRCSHKESHATLISCVDAPLVMDLIRELINEHSGIHLSSLRDINTERPRTTYITYEVQVEPGYQLPFN